MTSSGSAQEIAQQRKYHARLQGMSGRPYSLFRWCHERHLAMFESGCIRIPRGLEQRAAGSLDHDLLAGIEA